MDAIASHERPILPSREPIDEHRWVSIRPIERTDASALSDFYARLTPESRRRRFMSCSAAVDAELVTRFAAAPGVVGILREPGPRDGAIVAHAAVLPDGRGGAELAFAVVDELQGRGIGRRLVAEAVRAAHAAGCGWASASLLPDNAAMRRLLRSTRAPVVADRLSDGVEEISLDLRSDTAAAV